MLPATSRLLAAPLAIDYGIAPRSTGTSVVNVLEGLGEFGDLSNGTAAQNSFRALLEAHISGKCGPAYLANAKQAPTLAGAISLAANAYAQGEANALDPVAQAAWNQWRAAASGSNSDFNIYWIFGRMVSMNRDDLVSAWALANRAGNWWADPAASQASYTLLDSSSTGTTWMGGSVVYSKLSNQQWSTMFIKGWTILQKGLVGQVLSITYLDALCRGLLQAPALRRMPLFQAPPGNLPATDPAAIAFRCMMKQLGWNDLVRDWFALTSQSWAAQSDAQDASDASYASVITSLNYLSGKAIYDQIAAKLSEYWKVRADAAANIKVFDTLAKGPLSGQVPQAARQNMAVIRQSFLDTDARASGSLAPLGLWPAEQAQGSAALNGLGHLGELGFIQVILAGTVAVAALGVIAYIIATMTKTARDAAAQTRATTESILSTVDQLKQSCSRAYMASAKDATAEAALQACLNQTKALTDTIPPVPASSSDPFGFGKMTMLLGVAVVGVVALNALKKKT